MIMQLLTTLLVGAGSGLIMGMLGGGSGLILVPGISLVLTHYYPIIPDEMNMRFAVGTCFFVTVFFVIATVYSQHRRGAVQWGLFKKMVIGMIIGTILGNTFANHVPARTLELIFGALVILLGIKMLLRRDAQIKVQPWPAKPVVFSASAFFGLVCGALGVAPFVVPFLRRHGVSMHHAIATSTAGGLLFAIVGAITAILLGLPNTTQIPHAFGYVYFPIVLPLFIACIVFAEIGVRLAHRLPAEALKKFYCCLLFIVGIKMLF